jgi:hypothetical protein
VALAWFRVVAETNIMLHNQTIRQTCSNLESILINGNLDAIKQRLNVILGDCSESDLLEINKVIGKPQNIYFLIHLILKDSDAMEAVRKASYFHQNGFHKIVLLSMKNFKLRLHHFGAGAHIPMENIHDHRWPFASTILNGKLRMDLFEVNNEAAHGEDLIHYRYDSDKSTGSYTTTLMGLTKLIRYERKVYEAGSSYLMTTKELHRIINKPGDESITMILTGRPVGTTCNLYAKRMITEQEKETPNYTLTGLRNQLLDMSETVYPKNN